MKLSRDNHDNVNFVPALREFGLLPAMSPASDEQAAVVPFSRTARVKQEGPQPGPPASARQ